MIDTVEYIPLLREHSLSQLLSLCQVTRSETIPGDFRVVGVCNGRYPVPQTLCFVDRPPGDEQAQTLRNVVVLTTPTLAPSMPAAWCITVDDPRAVFIDLTGALLRQSLFSPFTSLVSKPAGIDASAVVHERACIEPEVIIGPGCIIAAGCVIKRGTVLGQHVLVRENSVLGCEGIARYVANDQRVLRFPHVAGVLVEDNVEIGAGCVIARGALNSTRLGAGSIIGNLCNLGHGVQAGKKTWMSVGCMVGGNTRLGDAVTLGLGVNVRDNLQIGHRASVAMGSAVMKNVADDTSVLGNPAKVVPGLVTGPAR